MKMLYLLPFLFLTACIEQPTNLRIVEVELVQVDYGFRALAFIWVKDADRGVTLRQEISCEYWSEEDVLKKKIGQKYKVFEVGKDVRPTYYKLSESFC
jgi:hypothetical protein